MGKKVIITGASGMAGEGVLHECLLNEEIDSVLVIGRKPCGVQHKKLKEIIHQDFYDISPLKNDLSSYDACFFCAGVSSVGMKEEEYNRVTYILTTSFAKTLNEINKDMIFCYISGAGTDSTTKGKIMWARVKGKTENDLQKMTFKKVYCFRPGYMQPTKGLLHTQSYYKYISWTYPLMKRIFPKYMTTLKELGQAMINAMLYGYENNILEVKDIKGLAKRTE